MRRSEYDKITDLVSEQVHIDRDTITAKMMDQAEWYFYYARAYHQAIRDCKLLEFQLEQIVAATDKRLSSQHSKVTEKMVRTSCHSNDIWKRKSEELIEAEDCRDGLESILRAFEHRRDMLVNLGATVREEMRSIENRTPTNRSDDHGRGQRSIAG